jgi:sec-independent protein translocase protein TatB
MFDVGFQEILLIALVALLVFGPDRLPSLIRQVTFWTRKIRSTVASVRTELDRELQIYEIQQTFLERKKKFETEANSLTSLHLQLNNSDEEKDRHPKDTGHEP